MNRSLQLLVVAGALVSVVHSPVVGAISVVYNGAALETSPPPFESQGRVLIGMRDIFEAMSAELTWNAATRTVTATQGTTTVTLTIGSRRAHVSGRAVALDVPPQIIEGTTFVPLRFVAEATGAEVKWQPDTQTVVITTGAGAGMPPREATGGTVPSPTVTAPKADDIVQPSVDVKGQSIPGATIRIVTYVHKKATGEEVTHVPGIIHNVWADGSFEFTIAIPTNSRLGPATDLYYDIHVWAVEGGEQSEPTIVRVYRAK